MYTISEYNEAAKCLSDKLVDFEPEVLIILGSGLGDLAEICPDPIIIDYKEFNLNIDEKNELIDIAKQYCESKNIPNDEQLEIALLDNEEAENFLEKVFNNMKVIRGLITKKD